MSRKGELKVIFHAPLFRFLGGLRYGLVVFLSCSHEIANLGLQSETLLCRVL
jgi:hypothetical protein